MKLCFGLIKVEIDEYFVIESSNPKVAGWDGAVRSFVDYLYELAAVR